MTLDSNSNSSSISATTAENQIIRATKTTITSMLSNHNNNNNNNNDNSTPTTSSIDLVSISTASNVNNDNNDVLINGPNEYKKLRILTTNDHHSIQPLSNGFNHNQNDSTTTSTTTISMPLCPTPVKIKKEDDESSLSPTLSSSSSSRSHYQNNNNSSSLSSSSSAPAMIVTNGTTTIPGGNHHHHQPVARKRTAYQALVGSTTTTTTNNTIIIGQHPSTNTNRNSSSTSLLSESSPEVSSSQNCTVISPVPSLDSSEIDLDLWNLDLHESSASNSSGKEEMSPSNSVNGYTNVDSLGGDPKKKKGPVPRQQEELCLVCGDRASGYHYNALTCEGCKGFFRRSITKNAVYQCKYGNNCEIDMYMRRKCQECRLKKCLSVGMRPECVVPEYQCAMKREAKRAIKDKDKPNSTTKEGLSPNNTQIMIIEEKQPLTPIMTNNWNGSQNGDVEIALKLSLEQDGIIKKLVFYQDEFESPSGEDIEKIAPFPYGENEEDNKRRFQHITEMTILTVQLIVEFSKRVPYFDKLFREDQITLLKACSSEVMMLRCSRKYDIKTDSIVYANNQPYTRQNYSSACISYVADTLFNFCRRMHMLKVDNAEYALLTAIVIFSDRPQLLEAHKVEEIQEKYIEILRIYVETRRPPNKCHFAKLLGILTELRTLGNINSEMCVSLKVQNKKLPAFLAEIWDIQDS
ncbi:ecdysone receptor-like isoform X2 [Dermatophagoides pteronyssinus]|uniref:Ecdysone receptor n=1 Tax=Dermatophagoides pteronyssinus TaxID=6956 RepID=A0A6P6Y047_DERPT|nr:ecdysone receptor-like isoform X2 [Dermatophagoides pteronyssinus]